MDEKTELEREREQLQRLDTLRQTVQAIFFRWTWIFFAVFSLTCGFFIYVLAQKAAHNYGRYEAQTSLLYCPKKGSKIASMDDKQVFHVFTRTSLVKKYIEALGLTGVERARAWMDLSITQMRGEGRAFLITTKGPTEASAVAKANTFADICMREYEAYRMADLEEWNLTIERRRKELFDRISQIDDQESVQTKKYGIANPIADIERLHTTINDQKTALSAVQVRLANEELKKKKLEQDLKGFNPVALAHAEELKAMQREMLEKEKEVAHLRGTYTELNPRLQVAMRNRDELAKTFDSALKVNGLSMSSAFDLERLGELSKDLKDTKTKLEVEREAKQALIEQIAQNEKTLHELIEVLPQFDRLKRQRDTLQAAIQGLEETVSDIRYLQSSVSGDVSQVERALGAQGEPIFGKKTIGLSIFAAFFCATIVWSLAALLDYLFGTVRGVSEVGAYHKTVSLGGVPDESFKEQEFSRKDVLDSICYRLDDFSSQLGTTLVGVLPGGTPHPELEEMIDWNMAMAGKRIMTLKIVPAVDFKEPANATLLSGVWVAGTKAWLPVSNVKAISPSEMRMLEMDVVELHKTYELILLSRADPVEGGVFTRQMMKFCNSSLFYLGARRTPRRIFRRILKVSEQVGKTPLILTTNVRQTRDLEMEG